MISLRKRFKICFLNKIFHLIIKVSLFDNDAWGKCYVFNSHNVKIITESADNLLRLFGSVFEDVEAVMLGDERIVRIFL